MLSMIRQQIGKARSLLTRQGDSTPQARATDSAAEDMIAPERPARATALPVKTVVRQKAIPRLKLPPAETAPTTGDSIFEQRLLRIGQREARITPRADPSRTGLFRSRPEPLEA